jgi:hypothetical protein
LRILFIADVVGKPGRWIISQLLRDFKKERNIDYTICNIENAAGGFGITREMSKKIFSYGVDVQTSGNHIWDREEIRDYLSVNPRLLRPANFPAGSPGAGMYVDKLPDGRLIGVINLQGRVYMKPIDCPFKTADGELSLISKSSNVIIVDIHAETTSEKLALAYYLDGRVSAVIGTHTHVQTADERILPGGTAFISDAGMTGPHDSIIGMKHDAAIKRFLVGLPYRFSVATDDIKMQGVILEVDDHSGRAISIERYTIATPDSTGPTAAEDDGP